MAAAGGDESRQSQQFGFDQALSQRFLEIAEPYFLPRTFGQDTDFQFGVLIFGLLLGVVSSAYFLSLAVLALASAIPALGALFPAPGAAAKLAELDVPPLLGAAGVAGGVAVSLFAIRREDLSGRWWQWGLLGCLMLLLLCVTGINVFVSYVFRSIDNVLVAKDEAGFFMQLKVFVAVLVVAVPLISVYRFVRLTLANNWREFLSDFILERYFQQRTFYLLDSNSTSTSIDNPDQRISEDIQSFTSETLGFLIDILSSFLNLVSFSAILWATSEQLTYALIAYALLGTVIALAVGGELIGINYQQLRLQADFRYALVHVRDNAEAIAFYQGESREREVVTARLQAALRNFDEVIKWTTGLTFFQKAFFYVARLVPYFVVGGLYFAGKVDFGTLGQVSFAFSMVLNSVTLVVSRIQDISRFSAGVNRLATFYEALVALDEDSVRSDQTDQLGQHQSGGRIHTEAMAHGEEAGVELSGVTVRTPTGRTLVEDVSLKLSLPEASGSLELPSRLLVVGSSGAGKSSLLRAVAGLWTQGAGRIQRPEIGDMLFLPQKPYMPLGDLRTQLLYPGRQSFSDEELLDALGRFGLGDLPNRFEAAFDTTADWTRVLSLGEQQRLAAARCLLQRPQLAVLDEATSALPVPDERNLYLCLRERGIGYISVGHRPSLLEHHDLVLELLGESRWRVVSPSEYERTARKAVGALA